ncbi:MAG TPA: alanyl-tRNA editing protein [Candidatus Poseidoniales archaeon]|jgi:misacylated tRNA(Ala) deacylase|nr:MAG: alanyl-tRNA editing protein [Euryarchaeota archaeon]HIG03160.1 alanyl-tRNA editing protein [Candidatus Poseidoniales archaeon]HIK78045.1 alanyl-tRNA editing protein [Candidatus Poseidoniales archaeon]
MVTEKLYMPSIDSCYETKFNAEVVAINGGEIVLNRSLFYPIGGGQNWDTGKIIADTGIYAVEETRGRDEVAHIIDGDHGLSVGDEITGEIDWQRRYSHMKMHTAQHVMSGIVYELFNGVRTVGNQIHEDRSRIDFNPIKFDNDMIELTFSKAQEMIDSDLLVTCQTMQRGQINEIMPPERTNMDLLPKSVNELRVIIIGDKMDLCPCAGTHVKQLSEIGELEFLGKKSKGKGTQRVSYTLN